MSWPRHSKRMASACVFVWLILNKRRKDLENVYLGYQKVLFPQKKNRLIEKFDCFGRAFESWDLKSSTA